MAARYPRWGIELGFQEIKLQLRFTKYRLENRNQNNESKPDAY